MHLGPGLGIYVRFLIGPSQKAEEVDTIDLPALRMN